MKKNGFTLVELIISITLLALIGISVGITLNKSFKTKETNEYESFVNKVTSSANVYLSNDSSLLNGLQSNKSFVLVKLGNLIDEGILASNLINPKTGEKIKKDDIVKVVLDENGTLKFIYPVEELKEDYLETKNITYRIDPSVSNPTVNCLEGINTTSLGYVDHATGNIKTDYFSKVKDNEYDKIKCLSDVSKIDTNKIGTYELKYSYQTVDNIWKSATRKVMVLDGERPKIKDVKLNPDKGTWTDSEVKLTATITDNDSLGGYCVSNENNITINGSDCECEKYITKDDQNISILGKKETSITANLNYGNYYICVKDITGNSAHSIKQEIDYVDTTAPTITDITAYPSDFVTNMKLSYTLTDNESGLSDYIISTSNTKPTKTSGSWIKVSNISGCSVGSKKCTLTYSNITKNTTYYIWAKDKVGNINNTATISIVNKLKKLQSININDSGLNYSYINKNINVASIISVDSYSDSYGSSIIAKANGTSYINITGYASSYENTYTGTCNRPASASQAETTCNYTCDEGGTNPNNGIYCYNSDYNIDNDTCYCKFVNGRATEGRCNRTYTPCGNHYTSNGDFMFYVDTNTHGRVSVNNTEPFTLCQKISSFSNFGKTTTTMTVHGTATCNWQKYRATCNTGYSCNSGYQSGSFCYTCNYGETQNGTTCLYSCQNTITNYRYNLDINYWVRAD